MEEKNALFNHRLKKTRALTNFHEEIVVWGAHMRTGVCVHVLKSRRVYSCVWRYVFDSTRCRTKCFPMATKL